MNLPSLPASLLSVRSGILTRSLASSPQPTAALRTPRGLIWPVPALLTWCAAWILLRVLLAAELPAALAGSGACALGLWAATRQSTVWRRLMVAGGFPLSALLSGWLGPLPTGMAWAWLLPVLALAWLYPVRTWGDAPLFPTPAGALVDLAQRAPLPEGSRVLDAGCGLGHGLKALRAAYPQARVYGIEWSAPIAFAARLLCPWAVVHQGDMWRGSWGVYDLVYLFQRPESMGRAWAKACAEMRTGAWLASLEFEVPGQTPYARLSSVEGKPVWLYRLP